MKVIAITQARTGSTRLPGKVFETIANKPLLQLHLERVKAAKTIDQVVVATTDLDRDDAIETAVIDWGFAVSRGSENDVLSRFYHAAQPLAPDYVVRVTSDCPFVDPELIDRIVQHTIEQNVDYCSNTLVEHYPDGQDIEVMTFRALAQAYREAKLASDREHVTPYIKRNSTAMGKGLFKAVNYGCEANYNAVRMCVDEPRDLLVARALAEGCGLHADWLTYTAYYLNHPSIATMNGEIIRNEGYLKSILSDKKGGEEAE